MYPHLKVEIKSFVVHDSSTMFVHVSSIDVLGIKMLNQSIAELSLTKAGWLPIYIDIATSHIRLLNKKVNITLTHLFAYSLTRSLTH